MKSRNTHQKQCIQSGIDSFRTFFTAEELYARVQKKDSSIGLATIYRYLKRLRDTENIYSYLCDGKQIYSTQKKSHCHFICEKTGKVIHFEVDSLDFLKNKIPGSIDSFQIEVRGVCDTCSQHRSS